MKIKAKYKGNKNIELDQDLNIPIGTEISLDIETQGCQINQSLSTTDEHFLEKIEKLSKPASRTDYSIIYHGLDSGIE